MMKLMKYLRRVVKKGMHKMDLHVASNIATGILGSNGALLSYSKSSYRDDHPDNIVVFNSNVCISEGKIWYGDIDVTKSLTKLQQLAKALDTVVYVIREMDARFGNEGKPLLRKAVIAVNPDGSF